MQKSIRIRLDVEDEQEYDFLIGDIQSFLLNDSLVISQQLNREEGPYTEPKTSNYIFGRFGNAFVDYSSHKYGDKEFEKGSLWFYIISEEPEKIAEYLSSYFHFPVEISEMAEEETALNYSRMPEKLEHIYPAEEIKELLKRLYANEFIYEPESLLENVFYLQIWLNNRFGETENFNRNFLYQNDKEELVKNLEKILGLETCLDALNPQAL